MSHAAAQVTQRRSDLVCLLCAVSFGLGPLQAAETAWTLAGLSVDIHRSMRMTDPPAASFHGTSESLVRVAADRRRQGFQSGYDWEGSPAGGADWRGIKRDTWYFLGYQFAAIGALYMAPESISSWSDEQKDEYSFTRWQDNIRNPRRDRDRWWINYVLHPYWGGAYYIRAQERGFDRRQSFLYSALLSTLFEFGAEALFEAPSYQDLIVTPVAGYFVGQYLFVPIRERIRAQPSEPGLGAKTALFLTDPLGVTNAAIDAIFGMNGSASLQLVMPLAASEPWTIRGQADHRQYGNPSAQYAIRGWGFRLRVTW